MPRIREILIEIVSGRNHDTEIIEDITEVVGNTEGLFEPDDGTANATAASELTLSSIETLRERIRENFSLQKFRVLAEVQEILRKDPDFYERRESGLRDTITLAAERAEICRQTDAEREENRTNPGRRATRIFGYILILCGIAAAIVGVAVPVRLLLGVGIGTAMLGIAVTYASLPKR